MTYHIDRRSVLGGMVMSSILATSGAAATRHAPFFKRVGKPLGVQLYALGDAPQTDLRGTLTKLVKMGYGDFELPGLYGRTAKELRADADAVGARFNSFHIAMPGPVAQGPLTLLSSPQEIADTLNALGVHKAVLPIPLLPESFNPAAPEGIRAALTNAIQSGGLDMWKRLAAILNERAAALRPFGIELGYHNHNMEFAPVGGTSGWDVLMRELDPKLVFIELDLGWVAAAGRDPAAELAKLNGRVRMVHVKDIKASTKPNFALEQDPAEVGLGMLDWRAILSACAKAGVEHYYVEQEPPFTRDRFESMKLSHDFLAQVVA